MLRIAVWTVRILVGAAFIVSGVAKMIDPYGFIYKIDQYLAVWHASELIPDAIVLLVAVGICAVEFIMGFMLATGSWRRTSAWAMVLLMAGMLPLSIYIAIVNPVDDCGCFGDFIVLSNPVTALKNIIISAGAVFLVRYNTVCGNLFPLLSQWAQAVIAFVYIAVIGLIGYHVQPLIDFRPYKVGTTMTDDPDIGDDGNDIKFIYADRSGAQKEFSIEDAPDEDDPEWLFVGRVEPEREESHAVKSLVLTDDNGNDITSDVFAASDDGDGSAEQLILLIPDLTQASIAHSYIINELSQAMASRGGSMVAVTDAPEEECDEWIDLSMADYPVYHAEATAIKTVARGNMALVYTVNDTIIWKRTVGSVNIDRLDAMVTDGPMTFRNYTLMFLLAELLLGLLCNIPRFKARLTHPD